MNQLRKKSNVYYCLIITSISIWLMLNSTLFKNAPFDICNVSFFIYALHQPVFVPILEDLFKLLSKNGIMDFQLVLLKLFGVLSVILVIYCIVKILRIILPERLYSTISGGR